MEPLISYDALFVRAKRLPGVFGYLTEYIDYCLPTSLPHISISAALSLMGTLKCKRLFMERPTHPALFLCVVAESGTGKSNAQSAISNVLKAANLQSSILQGVPVSDAGLLRSLSEHPRQLIIWDELGLALSHLSESKNSFQSAILSTMMQVYSNTGKLTVGKEYANRARVDIPEPYLNVYGASTPIRFFGGLNENFVHDGFLPRWLIFFQDEKPKAKIFEQPEERQAIDVPQEIVDEILNIEQWVPKVGGGNLSTALEEVQMVPINICTDALDMYEMIRFDFLRRQEYAKSAIARIFWSRAYENYCKILLAIADRNVATLEHVIWASDLVQHCILTTIDRCEDKLQPANREGVKEKFLEMVKVGEKISKSVLTRRSWRLNLMARERDELIKTFCEAQFWVESFEIDAPGDQRRTTFYTRIK